MQKDSIKTKFSKTGFIASVLVFLPYAFNFIPTTYSIVDEFRLLPKCFILLYDFISLFLILTLILVRNLGAEPFSTKSRGFSIANVVLGVYYIVWVYFFLGNASVWTYLGIKILAAGFLLIYSFDRKNWVAFSFSIAYLLCSIAASCIALVV